MSRTIRPVVERMTKKELIDELQALYALLEERSVLPEAYGTAALSHEFQVRQIELEMQNQQLIEDRIRAEKKMAEYVSLYEEIPIGHLLMDARGILQHANHYAKDLLGIDDPAHFPVDLFRYLSASARSTFRHFLKGQVEGVKSEPFLLSLCLPGSEEYYVEVVANVVNRHCRKMFHLVISDVSLARNSAVVEKFISDAAERFYGLLDEQAALEAAVELAVPTMADYAFGFSYDEEAKLRFSALRFEPHNVAPTAETLMRNLCIEVGQHWMHHGREPKQSSVTFELAAMPRTIPAVLRASHLRLLMAFNVKTMTLVPLSAQGRSFGAMIYFGTGKEHGAQYVTAGAKESYTDRVAQAMANAYMHRILRDNLRVRDTILAVVSHDLGNPLSAILLKTERAMLKASDASVLKIMKSIHECGLRMHRLTRDLLDVSSVERNELSIECSTITVDEIADQAIDVVREKGLAHGVDIIKQVHCGQTRHVACDVQRILQVLGNLLDNAIKFSPGGSKVTLAISQQADSALLFEVEDMGTGFKKADLENMFDQFWQQRDTAHLGHGLGLYISRGIVRAHGGEIWAENKEGHGARIVFTLPCEGPPAPRLLDAH